MITIKQIIDCPKIIEMISLPYEVSVILYVVGNRLVGKTNYEFIGDEKGVDFPSVKAVYENCKRMKVKQIIMVHNHPPINEKINTSPSIQDVELTNLYKSYLKQYDIDVLDHIIISKDGYYSFDQNNMI